MINNTIVTVNGHCAADPMRYEPKQSDGKVYATFRFASTPYYFDSKEGKWGHATTAWYSVKTWGSFAENILASVKKGDPLTVQGRLVAEEWQDKDNNNRSSFAIEAVSVGHDIRSGISIFEKNKRTEEALASTPEGAKEVQGESFVHELAVGETPSASHMARSKK